MWNSVGPCIGTSPVNTRSHHPSSLESLGRGGAEGQLLHLAMRRLVGGGVVSRDRQASPRPRTRWSWQRPASGGRKLAGQRSEQAWGAEELMLTVKRSGNCV